MSLISELAEEQLLWKPLPPGDFIRCLILQPGLSDSPLEGKLKVFKLDQGPQYEAISYVWGSKIKSETFVCDGRRIHITESLSMALHKFRHTDESRVMWADSICMNQDDEIEKSHQVALMGQIYSKASKVLIHMAGNDQEHASQLASLVSETNSYVLQELRLMDDIGSKSFPYLDTEDRARISQDPRWASMLFALSQPWFSRGWVVQEAALASTAMLVWGSQEIQFDCILRAAWWAYCRCFETLGTYLTFQTLASSGVNVHFFLYLRRFPQEAEAYGVQRTTERSELIDILQIASGIGMTHPKDRIFAFLALEHYCQPSQAGPKGCSSYLVEQDYTKSTAEVFTEFAQQYILRNGLRILQYGHPYDPEDLTEDRSMPSWVSRWGRPVKYMLPNSWEQEPLRPSLRFAEKLVPEIRGSTIVVTGVVFDKLRFVSQVMSMEGDIDEVTHLWRIIKDLPLEETYPVEIWPILMLECLCAGQAARDMEVTAWTAAREAFARFLMDSSQRPPKYLADKVLDYIKIWSRGRTLVTSTKGLLGIASGSVAEGDICCIIFGCSWPLILRPVPSQLTGDEQLFHLLGLAWIAGVTPQHEKGRGLFWPVLGDERSKDWVYWGLQEHKIQIV